MGLRGEQEDLLAPIWLCEEEDLLEEAKGLIAATRMPGGVAEIESASSVDRAARVVDQVSSPGRPPSEKVEAPGVRRDEEERPAGTEGVAYEGQGLGGIDDVLDHMGHGDHVICVPLSQARFDGPLDHVETLGAGDGSRP